MLRIKHRSDDGFTLVEVLAVLAIIGILTAIGIFSMSNLLGRTRRTACLAMRRSLLLEASMNALLEEEDVGEAFEVLYAKEDNKYTCPDGGEYSWDGQKIICDKHPEVDSEGGNQTPPVSVGGGKFKISIESGVDTKQYEKDETIAVTRGKVLKAGDTYYVGIDNFTPRKVSGEEYEAWLKSSYMVREIDFDKLYKQSDLGEKGLLNNYSNAPVGIGSVYSYEGKLYVQYRTFTGNTPKQSSDPTSDTSYWTLLGTIM